MIDEQISNDDDIQFMDSLTKKLRVFNVSWTSFFIILATITAIVIVLIVWTQTCCEEKYISLIPSTPLTNTPWNYNCAQLQIDYKCCRIKNFWKIGNSCIIKYQPVFLTECLNIPYLQGFDTLIVTGINGTVLRDDTRGFPKEQIRDMNPWLQKIYVFFYGVRD